MTDSQMWAYVAGFTDGEGCIGFHSAKGARPNIQITQSGEIGRIVMSRIAEFLGYQGVHSTLHCYASFGGGSVSRKRYKDAWFLRIHRKEDAIRFLQLTLPYLQVKHTIAQDILRFFILYPDWASVVRRKTHCVNGHPLTPDNIFSDTLPGRKYIRRRCKVCHTRYIKTWQAKRKAAEVSSCQLV